VTARRLPRPREDPDLLTGRGCFVDDLHRAGMLHGVFVRSPHAHARVVGVDGADALRAGADLVLTAADLPFRARRLLARRWHPAIRGGAPPALGEDRVRYVGEAVAFVLARDPYAAADLAERVRVEYAPLPVVASPEAAMRADAPPLHEGWEGNVAASFEQRVGDVSVALAGAERRLRRRFRFPRQVPVPLEPRGAVAEAAAGGPALTVWVSSQVPYHVRANVAALLDLPEDQVRVVAPHVGGGLGAKSRAYWEEVLVAYAALRLRRPVKWIEGRCEHMLATAHSRDVEVELDLGYTTGGRLTALDARVVVDVGAYVHGNGIITAEVVAAQLPGPYRLPHYRARVSCVGTNKTPLGTYRGAGQPEATFPLERALDLVAKDLGLSPEEVRRLNLLTARDLPYVPGTTLAGVPVRYESGDFPAVLARAVELGGRAAGRAETGERVGQGLALGLEVTGFGNHESALARIGTDGHLTVYSGLCTQGQGQPTTFARVSAEILDVPLEAVTVRMGDTALLPYGKGTFASRGAVLGASAVAEATARLRARVIGAAARLLEARPDDLVLAGGRVHPRGSPASAVTLAEIARAVAPGGRLFEGDGALEATYIFGTEGDAGTYALSAHVATVAVTPETGECRLLDYAVVHDIGRRLSPEIVDGQVHGGVVEGLGGALWAEFAYDESGQPRAGTLLDYAVPRAEGLPPLRLDHLETRPTTNPCGVRGVGEGGTLPVAAALANAIGRALGPGVHGGDELLCTLPLTCERVRRAAEAAGQIVRDLPPTPSSDGLRPLAPLPTPRTAFGLWPGGRGAGGPK
jgi:aerobic carbon-monoxide dehydrogenase large subunit